MGQLASGLASEGVADWLVTTLLPVAANTWLDRCRANHMSLLLLLLLLL